MDAINLDTFTLPCLYLLFL